MSSDLKKSPTALSEKLPQTQEKDKINKLDLLNKKLARQQNADAEST